MPALIAPNDYDAWLSTDTNPDDAQVLLHAPFEAVQTYPVSTYVNKPEHDGPRCVERVNS